METPFDHEPILLYWSGELSAEEAAEVEKILSSSQEAREYLAELEGLHDDVRAIPKTELHTSVVPESVQLAGKKFHSFPAAQTILWSLAAAVAIALVVVSQLDFNFDGRNSNPPVVDHAKLSDRLFASSSHGTSHRIRESQTRAAEIRNRLVSLRN